MKKRIFYSFISLLCIFFFVSCSDSKKSEGTPALAVGKKEVVNKEYLKVLPSDALAILKVDFGNVLVKSDVLNHTFVKAAIEKEMADAPENVKSLLKTVLNNPNASGINLNAPVYAAMLDVEPVKIVITLAIGDVNAFEKTLSTLSNDQFVPVEKGGMKYIADEREACVAYDSNKLVAVVNASGLGADVADYASLPVDRMAMNDKKYASLFSEDDDVAISVNLETAMQMLVVQGVIEREMMPVVGMIKDFPFYAALDFENGYADLKANVGVSPEYKSLIDKLIRKPNHSHFGYVPGNSLVVLNYNFDLTQLFPILKSSGLMNELNANGVSDENAKQILAALSGEWTGAMWLEDGDDEKPLFMAAVECSDRSIFDLVIAYLQYEMGATIVGDDVYALYVNTREEYNYYTGEYDVVKEGLGYYVMYKNNSIMIMPESLYYSLDNSGNFAQLGNSAKSNSTYASMNNNLVVDVEPIRSILTENVRNSYYGPSDEETIALEVMNMFKSLTADFNLYNLDIRLNLKNDNVNSLKCVVDKILGLAARFMK